MCVLGARYVKYSPSEKCFGFTKMFKLSLMQACNGNPFIIDIILDHEPIPSFFRFPYCSDFLSSYEKSPDPVDSFKDEL